MHRAAPRALPRVVMVLAIGTLAAAEEAVRRLPAIGLYAVPTVTVNRRLVPLGSPIELTYTWRVESRGKEKQDYRALLRFRDAEGVVLFDDDHAPVPPTSQWKPGRTYRYTRTLFVPVYPYVGRVPMAASLYPGPHDLARAENKGEGKDLREHPVGEIELLQQTENIFLVYKDGWHNPEVVPERPTREFAWTKREALVSFKNPKKDVLVYLEADTTPDAFPAPPVLTLTVNDTGITIPIEDPAPFLRKVRMTAEELGAEEWVDLRLTMNGTFVPKARGLSATDDRELGLRVYNVYVGVEEDLGTVPGVVVGTRLR
jgi:hypothetical protein